MLNSHAEPSPDEPQPTPVDLSKEDRALLADTALHGDAATLRTVLLRMVGKVRGGTMTSKKSEASRQNGKRGGRPKKVVQATPEDGQ